MTVTATNATSAAATTAATGTVNKTASTLGIDDFLTLMTSQLKNQDPTKPMDSTEMVAQLAQFGTVSGVQQLNTTMTTLSDSLRGSQALSGAALVGHEVVAQSDTASYAGSGNLIGGVDVPAGASSVSLTINDASGAVVRHLSVPAGSGQQGFKWDGLADDGTQAAAGTYTLKAVANVGGTTQALTTSVAAQVQSVSLDSTGTNITVNTPELGGIALSKVQQII